jgi:hypothetical protein
MNPNTTNQLQGVANPDSNADFPVMPEGYYPVTKEDKALIQEIGRKLEKFFIDEAASRGGELGVQILIGACDYVVTKSEARKSVITNSKFRDAKEALNAKVKEVQEEAVAFKTSRDEFLKQSFGFLDLMKQVDDLGLAGEIPEPFTHFEEEAPVEGSPAPTVMTDVEADAKPIESTEVPLEEGTVPSEEIIPSPYAQEEAGGEAVS